MTTSASLTIDTVPIHYRLNFERFTEHLIDVTLHFTPTTDQPTLWLPAWIPGSYLMREFARHITAVRYHKVDDTDGNYRAHKVDKNTWQLAEAQAGQRICVQYEVYCYDLSVRTAYVDQQRLYGNFTSLALAVEGQEQQPVQVSLIVPAAFLDANVETGDTKIGNDKALMLACGLTATHLQSEDEYGDNQHGYGLQAESYHELIDYPFEIARQDRFDFIIQDDAHQTLGHRFYLSGRHHANLGRLQADLTQICQTYVNWLGSAPFSEYTFMTYASGQDYGGLEHINSTSLITPRRDLPKLNEPEIPSDNYQRFLGLCSHEYFHAWWVKTVRPDVMLQVDLRREAYTPLLWVFEGFTSYIDDFMLQASGVIDKASYLKLLAEQINRYHQTAGRVYQSVAESSFDAWIKLYRSDENTGNAGISYYNKGALVALCLDLTLLQKSDDRYRLFDVVKAFYEQARAQDKRRIGISSSDMGTVISQFMPIEDWREFERRYINGVEALPLESLLAELGVRWHEDLNETSDKLMPWGIRSTETSAGLKVNRVQRGSIAARAGISAHDVIVAIDGIKADNKQLAAYSPLNHSCVCHLFRRDELIRVVVEPAADKAATDTQKPAPHKVKLSLARIKEEDSSSVEQDTPAIRPAWHTWLDGLARAAK